MKQILNKGLFFAGILLLLFTIFMSGCGGGSAPVPTGSNGAVCSPNLPPDMQKLLGCQPPQQQTPVSQCSANEINVILSVENYGLGSPVPGATVSLFTSTSNRILNQNPDVVLTAGSNGTATACLPVNTPFAIKASASSGFVDTCEFGNVVSAADANTTISVNLMSTSIVQMASSSAGVTQDPAKGAIVGTISDASGNPVSGVQVEFDNVATGISVTSGIFYGAPPLGLPDPALSSTSSAGVYLGFNVPPGAYNVKVKDTAGTFITEAYGEAITGSVSIVNIQE
ncbi:MAG: carboxypeptidase-like regulatory domain-containing protein [bacterium]